MYTAKARERTGAAQRAGQLLALLAAGSLGAAPVAAQPPVAERAASHPHFGCSVHEWGLLRTPIHSLCPDESECGEAPNHSLLTRSSDHLSLTVGGMAIQRSRLLLGKLAYERGRLAVSAELMHDEVTEGRGEGAENYYRARAATLVGRIYSRAPGRGFYGELGAGHARAALRSTDPAGTVRRDEGELPLLAYGGGVRFGRTRGGLFAELGLRSALFARELHLYTDEPPPGSREERLGERSWFLGGGDASAQLYVGLGYSF